MLKYQVRLNGLPVLAYEFIHSSLENKTNILSNCVFLFLKAKNSVKFRGVFQTNLEKGEKDIFLNGSEYKRCLTF